LGAVWLPSLSRLAAFPLDSIECRVIIPYLQAQPIVCPSMAQALASRDKKRKRCHLMQNGLLKAKVEGANTPALAHQILTYVPANADMDDLEVRGVMLCALAWVFVSPSSCVSCWARLKGTVHAILETARAALD